MATTFISTPPCDATIPNMKRAFTVFLIHAAVLAFCAGAFAVAPVAGQVEVRVFTAGGMVSYWITPENSKAFGIDGAGVPAMLSVSGSGGSTTFAALTDVSLTATASGDFLKWNGTDWINRTAANVRTDLGLVIGTNVQAYDSDLTTWTGITPGSGIGTWLATPSSANLASALTDETGSGLAVFGTSPTITTSLVTGSTTFTALSGATTLLTIGGTGSSATVTIPGTEAATGSAGVGALNIAGGLNVVKDAWINGVRVGRGGGSVNSNTALGDGAMAATATGVNNVAIGENSLAALLGGNRNVMVGHESGYAVTSGSENAGAGNQSLLAVTTGNYNSGFGVATLSGVTTASSNTALGYLAGTYRDAGLSTVMANPSGGIYIGNSAIGNADAETNAIVIGNAAIGEGSNKTVIGNSSTTNARIYGQLYGYPINVKAYGAKGDSRKVTDAVLNGTTTVTSATAAFTSADTGKVVWGVETATGAAVLPIGTATYVNSTTITCSVSATGSYTGVHLVLGTDDTVAIQAAAAAADAMSPRGQVYIPSGGYVFSDRLFNQSYSTDSNTYAIVGDGSSDTKLFPSPSHTLTGGAVFNTQANASFGIMRGITVDGSYFSFSGTPSITSASTYAIWDDIRLLNFKGTTNVVNIQTSGARLYNCHVESASYVGILVAGSAEFYGCYTGNHGYIAIHVTSGAVVWEGGAIDECAGPSVYLASSTLRISNALVYAGTSQPAVETTGTCSIYGNGTRFIPFGANNDCTGILLASSGTARLVNCILTGSGTGYGLNNSGTVYDVGGNTFTTTTGTAPVDALNSIVSEAHGGTGASSLTNLITLSTHTTGNYVADVAGTANEITSTHTPGEGSTATLSLPATLDIGGKTSFEIPNGSAPTVDAFGEIAGDNDLWAASRGAPVFFDGTAATALVNVLVSDAPSNGQYPMWNTGGTITWETPAGAGTVTATGGNLTANSVVLGAGTTDTKVLAGFTTDGTSKLNLGVAGASTGKIDLSGSTSGTVTVQPAAAAGTWTMTLPANDGDASQVLQTNGSGVTTWATAGGGISGLGSVDNVLVRTDGTAGTAAQGSPFVISDETAYSSQYYGQISLANGAQSNVHLLLTPKGTGSIIGYAPPDGTTTGGNNRGTYSLDLQGPFRNSGADVASGTSSVIISGRYNKSSGDYSFSGGYFNTVTGYAAYGYGYQQTASGNYSGATSGYQNTASGTASVVAGGQLNTASGDYSSASGYYASATRYGERAHASGVFAALGDAQSRDFVMRCKTTTNSAVEMAVDGATTYLTIPSGAVISLIVKVVGVKSDGSAVAHYTRQYAAKNVGGTSSEVTAEVTIGTDNAAGTSFDISTVDAGDYISLKPTGVTSETWRWAASVEIIQVAYGN